MIDIIRYTADRADEWNRFVAQSKNGTFLFDRGYMDYHADRFEDYSLMFFRDGRLFALLPANRDGDTLYSHRGLTYGGLVMDAKTGHLKTWVALDADMEKKYAGELLVHSCSASLTIPFRNGRPPKNKAMDATSPFVMAAGYNSLALDGKILIPTLKADSVEIDETIPSYLIATLKETLKVDRKASPEMGWLVEGINCWGNTATDDIYAEDDVELVTPIGKQIQFVGVFPIEVPCYTICVVANKKSVDITPAAFADVVNPLMKWLLGKTS